MQFYRRNLPHLQKDFSPHFITLVTKFRWILPPIARDIVLASCLHDHRQRYELYVAVVMPDHAHLILTPLIDDQQRKVFSLIKIMQAIKGSSARAINQQLRRTAPVWQEESFDHALRSAEGLDAKVDYVLQNPVRKGLVKDRRDYRWTWQDKTSPWLRCAQQCSPGRIRPGLRSEASNDGGRQRQSPGEADAVGTPFLHSAQGSVGRTKCVRPCTSKSRQPEG